jgi:organic hydroperoxide reductase OsmC/OhrA
VSQVAAKKKLTLRDERVKVMAHFRESGSVLAGTKSGQCDGFDIQVSIESDAAAEDIAGLIRLAHHMCFTEDALSGQTKVTTSHFLNGQLLNL